MSFNKIGNVLNTMQARVERLKKFLIQLDGWEEQLTLRGKLEELGERVQTYVSTPRAIKTDAVNRIKSDLADIRINLDGEFFDLNVSYQGAARQPLREVLAHECDALMRLTAGIEIGLGQLSPDDLAALIPGQKVAAYQFGFEVDRIIIIDQRPSLSAADLIVSEAARLYLHELGQRVLIELHSSNCPPRLKMMFENVNSRLTNNGNIVQLGMESRACGKLLAATADELSASLLALIESHLEGVNDYLAQFPEWRTFTENAAFTNVDETSVQELVKTARMIAGHLQAHPGLAAASVSQALDHVASLADGTQKPDGKTILALARSLENFLSLLGRQLVNLTNEVVKAGRKLAAEQILAAIGGSILAVAGAMSGIPGTEWLKQIATYLLSLIPLG